MQPEVERELILKCRSGGAQFYEPLVRAYEASGLRLAMGMLRHADEAQDALQEAFVKAYSSLGKFDVRRPFGPWFFQILRNQCRDMLRSRQSRGKLEVRDEQLELRPSDIEAGPDRARQRREASELLWKALARVGEDHREILVLKELEGFRYTEIAGILDLPEGTVASRLYHARTALRNALEDMGAQYP